MIKSYATVAAVAIPVGLAGYFTVLQGMPACVDVLNGDRTPGPIADSLFRAIPYLLVAFYATYFAGCVLLTRAKGRSWPWAALGIFPPLVGFIPLLFLKDYAKNLPGPSGFEVLPPKRD